MIFPLMKQSGEKWRKKQKKNKGSLFQVVSRRVGGVREGKCENDWGPDLGKAQARYDVAFGCWASGRPGCQNDGLSAALEPSDATQEEAETDGRAGWLEPQWTSLPAHAPCNTPAECVPSWVWVWDGVKKVVFLLCSTGWSPNCFAKHVPKGQLFYKTSESRWWSLHLLPSLVSHSLTQFCLSPVCLTAYVVISSGKANCPPRASSSICFSA